MSVISNLQVTIAWQIPINFFKYSHFSNSEKTNTKRQSLELYVPNFKALQNISHPLTFVITSHTNVTYSYFQNSSVPLWLSGTLVSKKHLFFHNYLFFLIRVMMRKRYISAQILSLTRYTFSANILCNFVCYAI